MTALFHDPWPEQFEMLGFEVMVLKRNLERKYAKNIEGDKANLNLFIYLRTKAIWRWALLGGLGGFFVIHPGVMIAANLMFYQRQGSIDSIVNIIFSEFTNLFSIQMLPWGLSFSFIGAIAGAFYGRSRQATIELLKSEKRFRELSITDDLTGLYNSRYFFTRLKQEIERTDRYGHPLTLLILDLDNFKRYNDKHGHVAGDKVIAKAGEILRESLRNTDSAFRYGGEEFTIILPETEACDAAHFAERLRITFENEAFTIKQKRSLLVTASIGVAEYRKKEEMAAFIKRADDNMYMAKKKGKNRAYFSE